MNVSNVNKVGAEASATGVIVRVKSAIAGSAWGSLVGKALLYLTGFTLLALVGAGRLHWPSPTAPRPLSVGVAEAAAAPLPSEAASVEQAPVAAATPTPSGSAEATAAPAAAVKEGPPGDAGAPAPSGISADGKVILNAATEQDLCRLPSIGAKRAKAILALRTRLGRFTRVEDLLRVKGIGRRSLARLKPLVMLDPT